MLGPFDHPPPFTLWCQINTLLTHPKDSTCRTVIMYFLWPLPLESSVNVGMPRDMYLGMPKKMSPPSAHMSKYHFHHH